MEQLAEILLGLLMGVGGVVPVVNWLKGKLNWQGWKALVLSAATSVIFGLLSLWQQGALPTDVVSWPNFLGVIWIVFFAAQGYFRLIPKDR